MSLSDLQSRVTHRAGLDYLGLLRLCEQCPHSMELNNGPCWSQQGLCRDSRCGIQSLEVPSLRCVLAKVTAPLALVSQVLLRPQRLWTPVRKAEDATHYSQPLKRLSGSWHSRLVSSILRASMSYRHFRSGLGFRVPVCLQGSIFGIHRNILFLASRV